MEVKPIFMYVFKFYNSKLLTLNSYHGKGTGFYPHSLNQDEGGKLCEHMCSEHIQAFHLFRGISPTAPRNNLSVPENCTYGPSSKHTLCNSKLWLCNGLKRSVLYHRVIFQITGEGNWVPEVFQAGIVGLHWTRHVQSPTRLFLSSDMGGGWCTWN